jgi:ABC-2 type transport system ATP-binding protein
MDLAIETRNLVRRYGNAEALRGLNLQVARNRVTGFLGRNGAGKSTTIRTLLGMTRPDSGTGTVLGHAIDNAEESVEIRRRVAYVGEDKELYGYMTVEELIRFTASFYPDWQSDVARQLQRHYQLQANRRVRELSKGTRTKLALLLALARRAELLILDEPTEGLDPVSIEDLLRAIGLAAAEGTTVFFSSHQVADVERVADDVCIVHYGKVAASFALDVMRERYRRVTLGFDTEIPRMDFTTQGVLNVRRDGRQIVVRVNENADAILERARDLEAVSVDVAPVSLLEFFLETVGDAQ